MNVASPFCEVIILNDFAAFNGGASVVALQSAVALARRGHRVTLFTAVGPVDPALLGLPNLEVICLDQEEIVRDPHRLRALTRGAWNRPAARALDQILKTRDPARTIIHAHLWMKALSPAIFSPAFARKFPVVVTLHDFFVSCPNGGFYVYPRQEVCHRRPLSLSCVTCQCDRRSYPQKLWRVGRTLLQKHVARLPERAAHFVGVSQFAMNVLAPFLPTDVPRTVVRNPIDCPDLGPAAVGENDLFVFAGRLVPEKGPRIFAEAARSAGIKAVFVGDGELRRELERDFPEITVTGWQTPAQVGAWLRRARALVFPSRWYETLGLVAVEAAANGVPVIVSDGCAARDTVADGERGLHFRAESAGSLADKLRRLAEDRPLAEQFGLAAYRWYWDDPWTAGRHVEDLVAVYRNTLDEFKHAVIGPAAPPGKAYAKSS